MKHRNARRSTPKKPQSLTAKLKTYTALIGACSATIGLLLAAFGHH